MKVDIYKCVLAPRKFVTLPSGSNLEALHLGKIDSDYANVTLLQKSVDLSSDEPRAGFSVKDIIREIEENGFSLHNAQVNIEARGPRPL